MPLPIMGQQQRINHVHPLNLPVGGVPQLISALLLMSVFADVASIEEVYHIPRSLKLVLFHFIEDFLQHKVGSFL